MEMDWMVSIKCSGTEEGEDELLKCRSPNAIWDSPIVAALLNSGICTIFVGQSKVARELNSIAQKLTGIDDFCWKECSPAEKIGVLGEILKHARDTDWGLEDRTQDDTEGHLEMMIEFCKRAEKKGLDIFAGWS